MENSKKSQPAFSDSVKNRPNILRNIFRTKPKGTMKLNSYRRCSPDPIKSTMQQVPPPAHFTFHSIAEISPPILRAKSYRAPLPPVDNGVEISQTTAQPGKSNVTEYENHRNSMGSPKWEESRNHLLINRRSESNIFHYNSSSISKRSTEAVIYDEICRENSNVYECNVVIARDDVSATSSAQIPYSEDRRTSAKSKLNTIRQYNSAIQRRKSVSEAVLMLSPESSDAESTLTAPIHTTSPCAKLCHRRKDSHKERKSSINLHEGVIAERKEQIRGHASVDDNIDVLTVDVSTSVPFVKRNFKLRDTPRSLHSVVSQSSSSSQTEPEMLSPRRLIPSSSSSPQSPLTRSPFSSPSLMPKTSIGDKTGCVELDQIVVNGSPSLDKIVELEYEKLMNMFTEWEILTSSNSTSPPHSSGAHAKSNYAHNLQKALIDQQKVVYELWTKQLKNHRTDHNQTPPKKQSPQSTATTIANRKDSKIISPSPTTPSAADSNSRDGSDVRKFSERFPSPSAKCSSEAKADAANIEPPKNAFFDYATTSQKVQSPSSLRNGVSDGGKHSQPLSKNGGNEQSRRLPAKKWRRASAQGINDTNGELSATRNSAQISELEESFRRFDERSKSRQQRVRESDNPPRVNGETPNAPTDKAIDDGMVPRSKKNHLHSMPRPSATITKPPAAFLSLRPEDVAFPTLRKVQPPREKCGVEVGRIVEPQSEGSESKTISDQNLPAVTTTKIDSKISTAKDATVSNSGASRTIDVNARGDLMEAIRQAGGFHSLKKTKAKNV